MLLAVKLYRFPGFSVIIFGYNSDNSVKCSQEVVFSYSTPDFSSGVKCDLDFGDWVD